MTAHIRSLAKSLHILHNRNQNPPLKDLDQVALTPTNEYYRQVTEFLFASQLLGRVNQADNLWSCRSILASIFC